jgi:hypothetical protein
MANLSTRQPTMLQHFETPTTDLLNMKTRVIVVNHEVIRNGYQIAS